MPLNSEMTNVTAQLGLGKLGFFLPHPQVSHKLPKNLGLSLMDQKPVSDFVFLDKLKEIKQDPFFSDTKCIFSSL